jgi:hypothetical protein
MTKTKDSTFFENKLLDFIAEPENNNINLVVVSSPRFRPIDNNYFLKELCKKHNITYIDLYDLDLFNENPDLFQDKAHLNHDGALIYTKLFFENLKPYLDHLIFE